MAKNQHLTHFEDLIFTHGTGGLNQIIAYIQALQSTKNNIKITTKFDGSPAIVAGTDPVDGEFFVGTKSVFNKNEPKICKNEAEIAYFYSEDLDLASKLTYAYNYLKYVDISGIWQGDLLFTESSKKVLTFDDVDYLTFTPNTLTYGISVNNTICNQIKNAKLGIVFHTAYTGETIADATADLDVVFPLSSTNDVWIADCKANYNSTVVNTPTAYELDWMTDNKEFIKHVLIFINQAVRDLEIINPIEFEYKFMNFYSARILAGIDDLADGSTGKAGIARLQKVADMQAWVTEHAKKLVQVFQLYNDLIDIKHNLIESLNNNSVLSTFLLTNNELIKTDHEGYVLSSADIIPVKLVNRFVFSRNNFLKQDRVVRLGFIEELTEARLYRNGDSLRGKKVEDLAKSAYLMIMMLEILRYESKEFARHYARDTIAYEEFKSMRSSATDLHNILTVLKNQSNFSGKIIIDPAINIPTLQLKRYLKDISEDRDNVSADRLLFKSLETFLKISNSTYKSLRRDIIDWDVLSKSGKTSTRNIIKNQMNNFGMQNDLLLKFKDVAQKFN